MYFSVGVDKDGSCQWVPWELPPTHGSTTFPTRAAVPVPITAFSYFHCFFASYCNISGTSDKTVREDLQCFQVFGFQRVIVSQMVVSLLKVRIVNVGYLDCLEVQP